MRRVLPVAIVSALLAVAPAAMAQHGGAAGHASGGFHGGFAGGHASFGGFHGSSGGFRGGYSTPGSYGRFTVPRFHGLAPRTSARAGSVGTYRPDYRITGRRGHYRVRHYGYGAYPGYVNAWEVLPWDLGYGGLDEDDDTSASQSAAQAQPEPEYESAMPENGGREDYAPATYQPAPQAPITPEPQLMLIYKDGHTQQVRNYALTQDALVDLDEADAGRVTHIPLASLNLPATEQAAQQAGLDFTPPAS